MHTAVDPLAGRVDVINADDSVGRLHALSIAGRGLPTAEKTCAFAQIVT